MIAVIVVDEVSDRLLQMLGVDVDVQFDDELLTAIIPFDLALSQGLERCEYDI